jgi:hypothetical protein
MTLFAAKILSPGAWAGKRRVASTAHERAGPGERDGTEARRHSNRRANCSSYNREPALVVLRPQARWQVGETAG